MKLSTRGEYALRALLVLAQEFRPDETVVRIQEISSKQNVPKRFLEQILHDLKSARIVDSKRGITGGYRLNRPPEKINLAEIIRHIEGALAPISCVSERFYERCTCPDEARCAIRSVMKEARDAIVKIMETVTLADLRDRAKKLRLEPDGTLDFII